MRADRAGVVAWVAMYLSAAGCASVAAEVESVPSPTACLPRTAPRWATGDSSDPRTIRVWLDEQAQHLDGWSTYGRRRLRASVDAWNRIALPVRMDIADSDRDAEVVISVVDSLPPQRVSTNHQAGLTRLSMLTPGTLDRAHVFVAVAGSYGVRYRVPDQEATLLHELGHALGLPHVTGPRTLMSERPVVATLTGADIALARSHYRHPRCAS